MSFDLDALPKVLQLYLEITQYPSLAPRIRHRMRDELFGRGVISRSDFDQEVRNKAIDSQTREGLSNPYVQESEAEWQFRLDHYRDTLTDFYFAHNLPHSLFETIVHDVLARRVPDDEIVLSFNPELAPWAILFDRGETYEQLPPEQRARVEHHLREIIVVLLKGLVSDHLPYLRIAKNFFTIADLRFIRSRRIGRGKIGGKAAGMLLGCKILELAESLERPPQGDGLDLAGHVAMPESYFIGADVFYDFIAFNDLHGLHDQKYRPRQEIEADYCRVRQAFVGGRFPNNIVEGLQDILDRVGRRPLIVRSSSLLEDNYGTSFAGKYESVFLPNQGTPQENLQDLLLGISQVYASVYHPDALFYRRQMGLLDYDERMAILLQVVQGEEHGNYFFPTLAGVAFSHNPFRWTDKIRPEDGFLRLVWGMGTRAVDRVAHDYPRMVALSHPDLRPEVGAVEIRRYSQHCIDFIDLAENRFATKPIEEVLSMEFPSARLLVSLDKGGYLQRPLSYDPSVPPSKLVLTFDSLLIQTRFVALMKRMLKLLSAYFECSVDIEFTADILPGHPQPDFRISLLQCRPQALKKTERTVEIPTGVPEHDVLFTADHLVPQGRVQRIRHIVFVDPRAYARIPDETTRLQIARVVGRLNQALEEKSFILMGPGRWGSSSPELGVKVTYADIYHAAMLVELGLAEANGAAPEVSYGTHFFQDLIETNIYPLAVYPGQPDTVFAWDFFNAPNHLAELAPEAAGYAQYVHVIDVAEASGGKLLEVIMDSEHGEALGYLRTYPS
jgi:hypothetical protein